MNLPEVIQSGAIILRRLLPPRSAGCGRHRGLLGLLGSCLHLYGELPDEVSEEVLAAVLAELVQEEPVAQLALAQQVAQAPLPALVILVPNLEIVHILFIFIVFNDHLFIEQPKSDGVKEEYAERGEEADGGPHDQELVPEPQQEVDLLVNDVLQCQYQVFLSIIYCIIV